MQKKVVVDIQRELLCTPAVKHFDSLNPPVILVTLLCLGNIGGRGGSGGALEGGYGRILLLGGSPFLTSTRFLTFILLLIVSFLLTVNCFLTITGFLATTFAQQIDPAPQRPRYSFRY